MQYKNIFISTLFLAAQVIGLFFITTVPVSAMGADECTNDFDGTSITLPDDQDLYDSFMSSDCTNFCSVTSESVGGKTLRTISCSPCDPTTPDSEACQRLRNTVDCGDEAGLGDCTRQTSFEFHDCGKQAVGISCLVNEILGFLSILVGILVVAGVIFGGIVYSTSQGNPAQVQKGITIIVNSVIGLVLYLLLFAIINWLVPGEVLMR